MAPEAVFCIDHYTLDPLLGGRWEVDHGEQKLRRLCLAPGYDVAFVKQVNGDAEYGGEWSHLEELLAGEAWSASPISLTLRNAAGSY